MNRARCNASPGPGGRFGLSPVAMAVSALLAGTASAQEAGSPADGKGTPDRLEEIVVTAQGRQQSILDVPYNISAVSGRDIELDHMLDAAELMRSLPGISVVDRGARNSSVVNGIRIRGLNVDSSALGDYAVGAAATVATYVNGTPLFANFLLDDIDRVEVLRGPQGTLYGSGALGGAVRYILNEPSTRRLEGDASVSLSSVDHSDSLGTSESALLNVPLSDTVAIRVSGTHNHFPGETTYANVYQLDGNGNPVAPDGILNPAAAYQRVKDADFAHQGYVRTAVKWKASENVWANLSFLTETDHYGGRRGTSLGTDGYGHPYQDLELGSVQLEPSNRNAHLAALETSVDMGFATLTSSTSHYAHTGDITSENTGFYAQNDWLGAFYYNYPRPMAQAQRTYSDRATLEELRLVSQTSASVEYVAGLYYMNQQQASTQDSFLRGFQQWWNAAFPGAASAVLGSQDYLYRHREQYRDLAAYGEATWHATPNLAFTGGLRSFRDRDETVVHQNTGLYRAIFASSDSEGADHEGRTIYKGNVSWTFDPGHQLYATVAEGYRRGGSNGIPTTGNFQESPRWLSYRADSDVDFEAGVKGEAHGLRYNADVFHVAWHNPQVNTATTNWGFFAVQNVASAATSGVELELDAHFDGDVHVGLGATYTNAHLTADAVSADGAFLINASGARLPGAPLVQLNATLDKAWKLGAGRLLLRLDAYGQSSSENSLESATVGINTVPAPNAYAGEPKYAYHLPGFAIWNASTVYAVGPWNASLWLKNIANAAAVTGVYTPAYMGTAPAQNYEGNGSKALVAQPRTVGLTLGYHF